MAYLPSRQQPQAEKHLVDTSTAKRAGGYGKQQNAPAKRHRDYRKRALNAEPRRTASEANQP